MTVRRLLKSWALLDDPAYTRVVATREVSSSAEDCANVESATAYALPYVGFRVSDRNGIPTFRMFADPGAGLARHLVGDADVTPIEQ